MSESFVGTEEFNFGEIEVWGFTLVNMEEDSLDLLHLRHKGNIVESRKFCVLVCLFLVSRQFYVHSTLKDRYKHFTIWNGVHHHACTCMI